MDEQRRQGLKRAAQRGLLVSCLGLGTLLPGCGGGDGGDAPTITQQPSAQTVTAGGSVTFSVSATGATPMAFQWQYAGSPVSGNWTDVASGASTYTINNVPTSLNGRYYRAVAVNVFGTTISNAVLLTVNP